MKYVIKWEDGRYVRVKPDDINGKVFISSDTLDNATQFVSIAMAIQAIVERADATYGNNRWRNPQLITIVGVKEINQPRYEEVLL